MRIVAVVIGSADVRLVASETASAWQYFVQIAAIFAASAVTLAALYFAGRWLSRRTGL